MLSHSAGMHNTDKSIAGISKRFHFASLHYIFSAYLPTHIKFLMEFHRIFFGTTCISFPNILSSGVFRRETASGFYPWGNVVSPPKRVAEGLCGWRHGNSFPMTQSAQSHRQMRSIPRCSKAVFYVFVFDSIHNSATLHNLFPEIFQWAEKNYRLNFFNFLTSLPLPPPSKLKEAKTIVLTSLTS